MSGQFDESADEAGGDDGDSGRRDDEEHSDGRRRRKIPVGEGDERDDDRPDADRGDAGLERADERVPGSPRGAFDGTDAGREPAVRQSKSLERDGYGEEQRDERKRQEHGQLPVVGDEPADREDGGDEQPGRYRELDRLEGLGDEEPTYHYKTI